MFIVFEGPEGSGKSSALQTTSLFLKEKGIPHITTKEPGGTTGGNALRNLIVSKNDYSWNPLTEVLIMAASRTEHIEKVIKPALEQKTIVLCDRFVGSTFAYQGGGHGVPKSVIEKIHQETCNFFMDPKNSEKSTLFMPDHTLLFDVSPKIGLSRSLKRLTLEKSSESHFENLEIDFHERVRNNFLEQAKIFKNYTILNAEESQADVQTNCLNIIQKILKPYF